MLPDHDGLELAKVIARVILAIILLIVVIAIITHPGGETGFYLAILSATIAFLTFLATRPNPPQ